MAKLFVVFVACLAIACTMAQQSPFGAPNGNPASSQSQQGVNNPPQQHQQPKNEAAAGSESPAVPEVEAHPTSTPSSVPSTTGSSNSSSPSHEKLTGKNGAASFVVASGLLLMVAAPFIL